jgi:cysteine synthase
VTAVRTVAVRPDSVSIPIGRTPVLTVGLTVDGVRRALRLKLESYNPCGSAKDRTALALVAEVMPRVDPAVGLIESTSGNLGVALAAISADRGLPFTAVVDPRTSPLLVTRMRHLGSRVVVAQRPDAAGGYLLTRLAMVADALAGEPRLTWTDQYRSEANPRAHRLGTAPETWAQLPAAEAVLVPVSTGGTLAGFLRFTAESLVPWTVVGVDVVGSAALGSPPARRLLSGIGSSRRSSFLPAGGVDSEQVTPDEAVACCLWLSAVAGVSLGASAGAAVAAALRRLRADRELRDVVCICPDGADRYLTSVYSAPWRAAHQLAPVPVATGVTVTGTDYRHPEPVAAGPLPGRAAER